MPTPPLPKGVRVNTAKGANLRAAPNVTAARVGFLRQLTYGQADQVSADSSGADWYRVTAAGQTGWIRGDLLVDHDVAYYQGSSFGIPGWSLLVPRHNIGWAWGRAAQFSDGGDLWWDLEVQAAPTTASLPTPIFPIAANRPDLYERCEPITIWNYSVTKRVFRAKSTIEAARGLVYITEVVVVTEVRAYRFWFVTPYPDLLVVGQVLDSINISQ